MIAVQISETFKSFVMFAGIFLVEYQWLGFSLSFFSFFRFESSKNQSHLWSMSDRTRVKVFVLWKKLAWPAQLSTTPWRLKGTVYVYFVLTVAGRFDSSCFDTGFLYWVLCLKNKGFSPKMFLLLHANYAQSNQNFCAISLLRFVSKRPVNVVTFETGRSNTCLRDKDW